MTFNKKISMKKHNNFRKYNSRKHLKYLIGGAVQTQSSIEAYADGVIAATDGDGLNMAITAFNATSVPTPNAFNDVTGAVVLPPAAAPGPGLKF